MIHTSWLFPNLIKTFTAHVLLSSLNTNLKFHPFTILMHHVSAFFSFNGIVSGFFLIFFFPVYWPAFVTVAGSFAYISECIPFKRPFAQLASRFCLRLSI